MRRTMFVGSWKTYKTSKDEVAAYLKDLPQFSGYFNPTHEVILCPSFVHLDMIHNQLPANVRLGAQDCSEFGAGAHTGETTAGQLASLGVKYCIVGHVERRQAGETDQQINGKIKQCLEHNISPIVCFGETLVEYDNDQTRVVLERQMRDCFMGVRDLSKVVLCYMPIWSIGTGFYTTGEYGNIIANFMRKTAVKLTGNPMSANCPVLFGGQITTSNTQEYLETPEIDGVIFAISALEPKDFSEIITTKFSTKSLIRPT